VHAYPVDLFDNVQFGGALPRGNLKEIVPTVFWVLCLFALWCLREQAHFYDTAISVMARARVDLLRRRRVYSLRSYLGADQLLDVAVQDALAGHWVAQLHELRVEIEAVHGRADHDEHRVAHLQERHHHLVKDGQVHVRGLLAVDDLGTYTAQSVRTHKERNYADLWVQIAL